MLIPLTICSFMGKSDSLSKRNYVTSFMAMSMAAPGILALLQEQDGDYFVTGPLRNHRVLFGMVLFRLERL